MILACVAVAFMAIANKERIASEKAAQEASREMRNYFAKATKDLDRLAKERSELAKRRSGF